MPRKTASTAKKAFVPTISQPEANDAAERNKIANNGNPPKLLFLHGGWCRELNDSYMPGYYQPCDWAEYEALKKHAEVCDE